MYKIIGTDQKVYGPVSSDQIKQWIAQRRVNAQTRAQADGGEWKCIGDFPEFAAIPGSPISLPAAPASPGPISPATTTQPLIVPPPQTSGLAIASLVLGILGILSCGLSALVGLVLGIIAMRQVRKSNGTLAGKNLALAGTIVSAVLLLIAISVGVITTITAVTQASQKDSATQCMNNVGRLANGMRRYAASHENHLPAANTWCESMERYLNSEMDFKCPAGNPSQRCHYGFNSKLDGMDMNNVSGNTVLFFEIDGGWDISGGPELSLRRPRHEAMIVVAFADGRVEQVAIARLGRLRWNP